MTAKVAPKEREAAHLVGWVIAIIAFFLLLASSIAWARLPWESLAEGRWRVTLWLVHLVLITVLLLAVGYAYSAHPAGIFISRQNRVSLSQLQTVLWSILFASAALTLFVIRFRDGVAADGLGFDIPAEAAALLGISTVSFGTAAGIKSAKRRREIAETDKERARRAYIKGLAANEKQRNRLLEGTKTQQMQTINKVREAWAGEPLEAPVHMKLGKAAKPDPAAKKLAEDVWKEMERQHEGVLFRNLTPHDSNIRNLVEGDEYTNAAHMDLGKLQMLIFAFIAIIAYALVLARFFLDGTVTDCGEDDVCLNALPEISTGLVGLLGASHVGYLTTKAAGATKSE